MNRALIAEVLHLMIGLALTALIFWFAAWSYPQGSGTIWPVGFVTMAAVVAMSLYEIRRMWAPGGEMRDN